MFYFIIFFLFATPHTISHHLQLKTDIGYILLSSPTTV